MSTRYLFVDRDGTLIHEPPDHQIDSVAKFRLLDGLIPALLRFVSSGYRLVMVTNQDGLGTASYPTAAFNEIQKLLMEILETQGMRFDEILVCPHFEKDHCSCRKPKTQLVATYLASNEMDRPGSFVIGDRMTDLDLAKNMGLSGYLVSPDLSWSQIARTILDQPREAKTHRKTKETDILLAVSLDNSGDSKIQTGVGFFDHMLEQLARHGGFSLQLEAQGDLHIDNHHLVEDVALALGAALRQALGDKRGIQRYGFVLPMDEAVCQVSIDLSGRAYCEMKASFSRNEVGGLPTEMITHFFRSLSDSLGMSLHIETRGENTHHMVECTFKAVGRALRQAFKREGGDIPSTKGML